MPKKGFFASLFDLSFTSFITTKIIKFLYVLTLVLIGLFALAFVIAAFDQSTGFGVAALLVLAPLGFLLYAIYSRVLLEFLIAVFRIMESNHELVFLTRQQTGGWSAPTTAAAVAGRPPSASTPPTAASPPPKISDDGEYWWDGSRWRSLREDLPPDVVRSPDGSQFYDGTTWRTIPGRSSADAPPTPSRTVIEPDSTDT